MGANLWITLERRTWWSGKCDKGGGDPELTGEHCQSVHDVKLWGLTDGRMHSMHAISCRFFLRSGRDREECWKLRCVSFYPLLPLVSVHNHNLHNLSEIMRYLNIVSLMLFKRSRWGSVSWLSLVFVIDIVVKISDKSHRGADMISRLFEKYAQPPKQCKQ